MQNQLPISRTFLIVILGVLAAIGPFTIDMYLPGFSAIAKSFGTNEKQVAFTLTSYFIGIAIGQLFYGPIIDKYGRKKPLLFGIGIYAIAALGIALAPNIGTMIGMRFLQALGGCAGMVATNAIISDVYEKEQMAKAFSSLLLVMGVAPLIAPSAGSFFISHFEWQYIFYFLFGFALLVLLMLYFFLPETNQHMHTNKLRIKSVSKEYWHILNNAYFIHYSLASGLAMSVLFAYISSAAFIYMNYFELSSTQFSLFFAMNAVGFIGGSNINGWLVKKHSFIKIGKIASLVLSVLTLFLFLIFWGQLDISVAVFFVFNFFILFIIGFINPNANTGSLIPFKTNAGAASALSGFLRMALAALIAAAVGLFQGESPITFALTVLLLAVSTSYFLLKAPNFKTEENIA